MAVCRWLGIRGSAACLPDACTVADLRLPPTVPTSPGGVQELPSLSTRGGRSLALVGLSDVSVSLSFCFGSKLYYSRAALGCFGHNRRHLSLYVLPCVLGGARPCWWSAGGRHASASCRFTCVGTLML